MTKMRITLAQIPVLNDVGKNLSELKEAVLVASNDKADILLTPEGSLSGYTSKFNKQEVKDALAEVTAFASHHNVGLALGTCFYEDDWVCYDELRFYLPTGEYLGCHTKTLLCGNLDEPPVGEINEYGVMPLRVFDYMGIKIGGLVCNDMWANPFWTPGDDPNLVKKLSRLGAKIIFHTVNGGRDDSDFTQNTVKTYHEVHVLMKAKAHNVFIATVDNAYPTHIGTSSYGGVVSPDGWLHKMKGIGRQIDTVTI